MSLFSVGVNSREKNLEFDEYVEPWQAVYNKHQLKSEKS